VRIVSAAAFAIACGSSEPPTATPVTPPVATPPIATTPPDAAVLDAAVADALVFDHASPPCDPANAGPELALGAVTNVDKRRVYPIAGTSITLCVVRTAYPYAANRGHTLWAMVDLADGEDTATYDLDGKHFARWHGVRVDLGVARKDFRSPDVWVRVTRVAEPSPQ
jgi:hypothetical protein